MKRTITIAFLASFAVTLLTLSTESYAATITYTDFVETRDLPIDRDVACVAGGGGSGGCSQAMRVITRYAFPRFDTNLGTLESVTLSTAIQASGVYILRPEDSFFSASTDGSFTVSAALWADYYGRDDKLLVVPAAYESDSFRANYSTGQIVRNWTARIGGTQTLTESLDYYQWDSQNPEPRDGPLGDIELYYVLRLLASLDGNGGDCIFGTAPCGATNRVTDVAGDISVTYEYSVTAVPLPASVWLFASALMLLSGRQLKRSQPNRH